MNRNPDPKPSTSSAHYLSKKNNWTTTVVSSPYCPTTVSKTRRMSGQQNPEQPVLPVTKKRKLPPTRKRDDHAFISSSEEEADDENDDDDDNSHGYLCRLMQQRAYWKRKLKESEENAEKWRNLYQEKCNQEKQTQKRLTMVRPRGLPAYPNNASPRGICLVVNNNKFEDGDIRHGSELDQAKLANLFDELNFYVGLYNNLTRDKISSLFTKVASMNHTAYDIFVSVIMTHGANDKLFGTDGRSISIENLTTEFLPKHCPSLSKKLLECFCTYFAMQKGLYYMCLIRCSQAYAYGWEIKCSETNRDLVLSHYL